MRHNLKQRLLALVLVACTFLGLGIPAQAASIADGSKTCSVTLAPVHNYLQTTAGTWLRAGGYDYKTNDNITGPAYCIDHGLSFTDKVLPIAGKYNANPAVAGVFANGYPQFSVEMFLDLNQERNAILEGLTEYEFRYATQVAVWAALGQLGVDGTAFTSGREYLNPPTGDVQQARVFRTVQLLLATGANWDRVYQTGMYIRLEDNALGGDITIDPHALHRRYETDRDFFKRSPDVLEFDCGLSINLSVGIAFWAGKRINLRPIPLIILVTLASNVGETVSKEFLVEKVWKNKYDVSADTDLKHHISQLRKKLKELGASDLIETVWGVGYKLKNDTLLQ